MEGLKPPQHILRPKAGPHRRLFRVSGDDAHIAEPVTKETFPMAWVILGIAVITEI